MRDISAGTAAGPARIMALAVSIMVAGNSGCKQSECDKSTCCPCYTARDSGSTYYYDYRYYYDTPMNQDFLFKYDTGAGSADSGGGTSDGAAGSPDACVPTKDSYEVHDQYQNNNTMAKVTELKSGIDVCTSPTGKITASLTDYYDEDWFYLGTAATSKSCFVAPVFTVTKGYKMWTQFKCNYGRIAFSFSAGDGDTCVLNQQPTQQTEYAQYPGILQCNADNDIAFGSIRCIDQTNDQAMGIWINIHWGPVCVPYSLSWSL